MSLLGDAGLFGIRHAGNLCKTQVLFLATFGALYALRVNVLISLAVAACCAAILIVLFTYRGERALRSAAFVGCCGLMLIDAVQYVARADTEFLPAVASLFGAIGYVAASIPARQISIWDVIGVRKPPEPKQ